VHEGAPSPYSPRVASRSQSPLRIEDDPAACPPRATAGSSRVNCCANLARLSFESPTDVAHSNRLDLCAASATTSESGSKSGCS
jgi:hypothetical protein